MFGFNEDSKIESEIQSILTGRFNGRLSRFICEYSWGNLVEKS